MSRIKGAIDKKPRKKRTRYAGKLIKKRRRSGKLVKYVSTRSKGDPIKIWFWKVEPMLKSSYKNFHKRIRKYMRRKTYLPVLRMDVSPEDLSTKENVARLCIDNLWAGHWLLKTFSHAKNKFHVTNRAVAEIIITDSPTGLRAKVFPSYKSRGLYRYWFWRES